MEPLHSPNWVEHWEYAYNQCGNKESYVCPGASACDRRDAVGNCGWSHYLDVSNSIGGGRWLHPLLDWGCLALTCLVCFEI